MVHIKAKHISFVTSALLLSSIGFSGCGDSGTTPTTTTYKGTSIDGYLKGATVLLDGHKAITDANGSWSISITGNIPANAIVTTTGGIDVTTGEKFEGKLSAMVDTNNTSTITTPLTSLVVSLVQKGLTKEEALAKVAEQLNVPISAITSDPIANLSSDNPSVIANAQKVIKQSLIVQKVAEAFAKSVVVDANNTNFNKVTNAVFEHIANNLDENNTLDDTLSNTSSIATGVKTIIKNDTSFSNDDNIAKKLVASTSAIHSITDTLVSIAPENITKNSIDKISKAIEIITATTEKKLTVIAKATTSASIEAGKTNADDVADGFLAKGIDNITASVTKNTDASEVVNKIITKIDNGNNINNINIINIIDTSGTTVDNNATTNPSTSSDSTTTPTSNTQSDTSGTTI